MSRYIDADALKPDYYDEYVFGDDEYVVRYYSETQIDTAPSIDLADYVPKDFHDKTCEAMAKAHQAEILELTKDRPQGEWLKFGLGRGTRILFCTNCERKIEVPLSQGDSNYDFCPNCGADMRKGADDE